MARITVEDCIDKVANRFELVAFAAQRARHIISGAPLTVERNNDKAPVIALREIALGHVKTETLREEMIQSFQTSSKIDQIEEESVAEDQEELTDLDNYLTEPYIDTVSEEGEYGFEDDANSSESEEF
jgi:DNA-directed RNA polymerase subunit omega